MILLNGKDVEKYKLLKELAALVKRSFEGNFTVAERVQVAEAIVEVHLKLEVIAKEQGNDD
jgi:hypothetical protein